MDKPYILALFAMRHYPAAFDVTEKDGLMVYHQKFTSENKAKVRTEIRHWAHLVFAPSIEAAKKLGMDFALEDYPIKDGWVNHQAGVKDIKPENVKELIKLLSES